MKEDIDAIIVGQIKGVLDQWEEPYRPEDWEKLQRKRKKDRRGILWLPLRYAGLLLVLFTTGVLVHYFSEWGAKETPDLPLEQIKERVNRDKKEQENPFKHTVRPQQHRNTPDDTEVTASQEKIGVRIQSKKGKNIRSPAIELRTQAENKARKNHLNGQRDSLKELFHSNDLEGMALKEGTLKNSHEDMENIKHVTKEEEKVAQTDKEDGALELPDEEKFNEETLDEILRHKIRVGLVFSPMVNYNQSTGESHMTLSGGAVVEVPLVKNIDLYTGLSILNQRIHFEENPVNEIGEGTQLKSRQAILTGLELPINLKYNFKIKGNPWFATAGVSSTTYFQEKVESTFQETETIFVEGENGGVTTRIENSFRTESEDVRSESGDFNFAGILNVSIGIELPINNKKQSLVVEPFFHHSLVPVTRENINFNNAGVKLRFNFNSF